MARVVVSVPHSGTRTLVRLLDLETHFHFGDIDLSSVRPGDVHVPIRHPIDVAMAWARRGKPLDDMLERYALMMDYLDHRSPWLYRMESLPRLAGTGEPSKQDGPYTERAPYLVRVIEDVIEPHRGFFGQFYPEITGRR